MNELKKVGNIDRNGDICHLIRKIASKNYRIGEEVYRDVEEVVQLIETYTTRKELEARIDGMESAKSRVLRRTEIPRDAKNPTRDWIVILGEEIAGFINDDITQLSTKLTNKEMK